MGIWEFGWLKVIELFIINRYVWGGLVKVIKCFWGFVRKVFKKRLEWVLSAFEGWFIYIGRLGLYFCFKWFFSLILYNSDIFFFMNVLFCFIDFVGVNIIMKVLCFLFLLRKD